MKTFKQLIKKTSIGNRIAKKKQSMVRIFSFENLFNEYFERYKKYSIALCTCENINYLRTRIIIESHVIEKGLSHKKYKPGFGKETVSDLASQVLMYSNLGGKDNFAVSNAVRLLSIYHEKNKESSFDDKSYLNLDAFLSLEKINEYSNDVGVKNYQVKDVKKKATSFDFYNFESIRSSVRVFDYKCDKIDHTLLAEIVDLAKQAPSACNRQSVRVHYVESENQFLEIEKLQRGSKGFLRNASVIAFITSDLSLYETSEYKLPIFDSGLFTMNFVYALHSKGLFSCILNGYFNEKDLVTIQAIANIPENEEVNCVIAIYDIPDIETIKVPISPRRKTSELYTIE